MAISMRYLHAHVARGGYSVSQCQRVSTGSRNILRVIAGVAERACHSVESVSHF